VRAPALHRDRRALLAGVLTLVAVLAAAACGGAEGLSKGGDAARGKQLFVQRCGSCHTLADAGTTGRIGPNLDDAFRPAREQGFDESSIQQVVAGQINFPLEGIDTQQGEVTPTGAPVMPGPEVTLPKCAEGAEDNPPGCVEDQAQAADDIAAYVASVAGERAEGGGGGGGQITTNDGKQIFLQAGCGSCHTLADAGTTGTIGPNLDQARPPKALAVERVTNGRGAMPSFQDRLTERQIDAVAEYVSSVAGT
jgi:mono/diheme cytochrome c family protein